MSTEIRKYQVNGEMVWQGNINKVNGHKLEKPVHYYVRPLNIKDAEAMGKLSETIYANLGEGQECFIHKHSKEYYNDVFKNENIRYVGAFVGKELVGMSYIKICENQNDLQDEIPNCEYDFFNRRQSQDTRVATFGADSVHPAYRGNAINTAMRELFLQIVYGRSQSAFSEGGLVIGAGMEDLGKGERSMVGTMYGTKAKGVRYLEMTEGYCTRMALDADNQVIGYEFVSLGKMTDFIKKGMEPNEAYEKSKGTYGRFNEAVKYIDPRKE